MISAQRAPAGSAALDLALGQWPGWTLLGIRAEPRGDMRPHPAEFKAVENVRHAGRAGEAAESTFAGGHGAGAMTGYWACSRSCFEATDRTDRRDQVPAYGTRNPARHAEFSCPGVCLLVIFESMRNTTTHGWPELWPC